MTSYIGKACMEPQQLPLSPYRWIRMIDVEPRVRPCPHQSPEIRSIYVACGEHDICTWPVGFLS